VSASPWTEGTEFERLYRRWWPEAVSLCGRLLGRADEAEDAAQEAFLRAWVARERYSSAMPFWPWLATIARRLCLDRRRRTAAEPFAELFVVADLTPEHVVVSGDEMRSFGRVVGRLRPAQRRALVHRELDGWSYGRIAAVEGVTVEAVRGSLKRARASLRRSVLEGDTAGSVWDRSAEGTTTARRPAAR
jgi:RNA polymerase sigma-70 factor, ECF subfamily